jgi:glycosyltransferase involved in cell wall biosynthesis
MIFQIILIDDGSIDQTFSVMKKTQEKYPQVEMKNSARILGKVVLSRRVYSKAVGDIVITLDLYLQDDPKEIPRMIEKIEEADDVVLWLEKESSLTPGIKTFHQKYIMELFAPFLR